MGHKHADESEKEDYRSVQAARADREERADNAVAPPVVRVLSPEHGATYPKGGKVMFSVSVHSQDKADLHAYVTDGAGKQIQEFTGRTMAEQRPHWDFNVAVAGHKGPFTITTYAENQHGSSKVHTVKFNVGEVAGRDDQPKPDPVQTPGDGDDGKQPER